MVRTLAHQRRRDGPGDNDRLVLDTRVTGKSGYKLTVAGQAQARGFVPKIDIDELDIARHAGKHTFALSMTMTPGVFERVDDSLAVALIGSPIR